MDGVTIRNRVDREFGMVPRALWQMHLSFAAKGLAAYLCCLRDGDAVPHVAAIEQATGLSRDARRRAFAELIAAGVIAWRSERERGRVLGRFLEIDHAAMRAPVVRADGGAAVVERQNHRPPESQAVGEKAGFGGENHRPPENPTVGVSVADATENRPASDGKSGDTLRERKIERARVARAAIGGSRAAQANGGRIQAEGLETGAQRAAVAASLGLPVRGADGAWHRAAQGHE